jgi:hypothetical protein
MATVTSFTALGLSGVMERTFALFPKKGWRSDDKAYLRTMIYGAYFREDEQSPPADTELIAIEGFGAYRPAQFADTMHPRFQRFLGSGQGGGGGGSDPSVPVPVRGTPFFIQEGTAWADFQVPPRPTLAQRRAAVRDHGLYGRDPVPESMLPRIAAPVTLMIDGSTFTPEALVEGQTTEATKVAATEAATEAATQAATEAPKRDEATKESAK